MGWQINFFLVGVQIRSIITKICKDKEYFPFYGLRGAMLSLFIYDATKTFLGDSCSSIMKPTIRWIYYNVLVDIYNNPNVEFDLMKPKLWSVICKQ